MATPVEFRAKRTHARRSCDLCKLRKTRCELPDLDIAPGPDAQPYDKACHRCQVLSLPCVVNDAKNRQRRKDPTGVNEGDSSQGHSRSGSTSGLKDTRPPSPKRSRGSRAPVTNNGDSGAGQGDEDGSHKTLAAVVNDSLEIMQAFNGEIEPALRAPSSEGTPTGFVFGAGSKSGKWDAERMRSMRYHARPYEMVAAMLNLAYGRVRTMRPRSAFTGAPDVDRLVDEATRQRLETGYNKLRTYHPHLEKMSSLFSQPPDEEDPSRSLLLCLVIYLSTLAIPATSGQRIRDTLTPYIYALRDDVLQQLPYSFATLQALEIMWVHAPYGVLPLDTTSLPSLALARGTVQAAAAVAIELNASLMIRTMSRVGHMHIWLATDTWTWLSTCAAEAASRIEDEMPRIPTSLADAKAIVELFYEPEDLDVWRKGVGLVDEAEFTGRLYMCDRLLQLAEVLDSCARSRGIVETASKDLEFDAPLAMDAELRYTLSRLDELDKKFQAIYNLVPVRTSVTNGFAGYRQLRAWFGTVRVFEIGVRYMLAVQFLHDPNAPQVHTSSSKISAVINRAFNPAEVTAMTGDGTKASTAVVWHYGRERQAVAERIVAASPKILAGILHAGEYSMVPAIDTMCIAVESSKTLLEAQGWRIVFHREHRPLLHEARHPPWIESLRATSSAMHRLATFSPTPAIAGLEPLAIGCAQIVASLMRVAIQRSNMLDANPETATDDPPPMHNQQIPQLQQQQQYQQQLLEQQQQQQQQQEIVPLEPIHPRLAIPVYEHSYWQNGMDATHHWQQQPQQQQQTMMSPHDYMNTSDRWMATGTGSNATSDNTHPQQYDPSHPVQPNTGYPVMIDQILSEALAYSSYDAPSAQPQPHQPPPTQSYGNGNENGHWQPVGSNGH